MKKYILILALLCAPQFADAAAFYVDFGTTTCTGAGTATTTAFCSVNDFANVARNVGDIAFVRRGQATTTGIVAMAVTTDGNLNSPIFVTADYDNLWGDFASSSETWTPTFGSTYLASSASSTTAFTNKWIYLQGDCAETYNNTVLNKCEFAYEIASSSPDGISLYLPYKGNQTGSGINMRVMPAVPQIGTVTQTVAIISMSGDDYWYFKGLDLRGTATSLMTVTTSKGVTFMDSVFQGDGVTVSGTNINSVSFLTKIRIFNVTLGLQSPTGIFLKDARINCNAAVAAVGTPVGGAYGVIRVYDADVTGCSAITNGSATGGIEEYFRNLKSPDGPTGFGAATPSYLFFEDKFSTPGLNSQTSHQISSNSIATTTVSTTTNLRAGGGVVNHFVDPPSGTGNTGISTNFFPFSYIKLFEYPIYANTSSKTYSVYFNSTSTSNFTIDPLTSTATGSSTPELYIECEYYNDASDADRQLKRSSTAGAVDFNGSTAWQAVSVTCQPTQSGILYLRGWYAKPKEAASNYFYMDTTPVIE